MSDLIDRKALFRDFRSFVDKSYPRWNTPVPTWNDAVNIVGSMPSVKTDIIRCYDCKWWMHDDDTDPYGYCYACKSGSYTEHWEISIRRKYKGDFFCADAELRDEEDDE